MPKLTLHIRYYFVLILFLIIHLHVKAQLTYNELSVQYDSQWTFKKLQLIPIRFKGMNNGVKNNNNIVDGKIINFSDALHTGKVTVKENSTGGADVGILTVRNRSKETILLLSGAMVQGGKQDRAFGKTTIIPPGRHKNYMPVFCVEKGRWDDKARSFKYAGTADTRVRKQIDITQRQSRIWKQIDNELVTKNKKNKTSAYLQAYNDSTEADTSYIRFFKEKMAESDSAYAGFIAVTGNRIINAEIFSGSDLCLAAYLEIIRSYVHSLIPSDGIPIKPHDDIKKFTDKFLPSLTQQKKYLSTNGRMYYYNGSVIHLIAYD